MAFVDGPADPGEQIGGEPSYRLDVLVNPVDQTRTVKSARALGSVDVGFTELLLRYVDYFVLGLMVSVVNHPLLRRILAVCQRIKRDTRRNSKRNVTGMIS